MWQVTVMLSNDVSKYTSEMTFEEFLEWYKEYHRDCWLYDYGNCDVCDAIKAKILLAYDNAVKTSDKNIL